MGPKDRDVRDDEHKAYKRYQYQAEEAYRQYESVCEYEESHQLDQNERIPLFEERKSHLISTLRYLELEIKGRLEWLDDYKEHGHKGVFQWIDGRKDFICAIQVLLRDIDILLGVDLGEANVSPQDDINVLNFRKSAYKARLQWEAYVQGYASDDDDDETVLDHSVSHDTVNSLESFSSMASLNSSNKESDEDHNKTWETDRLQEQTVAQILTHPGASGDSEATSQEQPKWPVDLELLKSRTKLGERVKPYTGPYEGRPAAPLLYGDDCRRLIRASSDGRLDDVKTFVESGIKADAQHGAALIAASANNHLDVVKYLVGQGVDVNVQNGNALIKASRYGHVEVVRFLVEQGADTFSQDRSAFLLASKPEIKNILRAATQNRAS